MRRHGASIYMIRQRDIFLVPFPFSDQSGQKVRPVLVLSHDSYNQFGEDIIVCAITSNFKMNKYSIIVDGGNLEAGKLYEKSCIKIDSLLKINKKLIIKNIGTLNQATFQKTIIILKDIFGA